jgi:hypothetical protein
VEVDEFDIFRTSISPDEAEPPLRVDANAVLPATVADRPLQPVARWETEVLDILRHMDQFKLSQCRSLHDPINTLTYCSFQMRSVALLPNDLIMRPAYNAERQ